jgi:hypothetical protein
MNYEIVNEENINEIESLISNARHLIDQIHETQKEIDANAIMDELEIAGEESSDEKIREYEQKLFPYLTRENLVLLLKTYKRLVSITSVENHNTSIEDQTSEHHDMEDISVNLETRCSLRHSNDTYRLVRSNSETLLNEIRSLLTKNNSAHHGAGDESNETAEQDPSKNLIVTNLPNEVFTDTGLRYKFESLFLELDEKCAFYYFKSFKRCRVECHDFISALLIKFELHDHVFANTNLKVYITQVSRIEIMFHSLNKRPLGKKASS